MKNKKKWNCKYKKNRKKNSRQTSAKQKQKVNGIGFTFFEIAILITILGIIGNFIYLIIHWQEAADSAKEQLSRYGVALQKRIGAQLCLKTYTIVSAGFERLLGQEFFFDSSH